MKCMCAQTRPRFILSSERVFGGMEFEPMLTPREKSPLPENFPQRRIEPATLWTASPDTTNELFQPPFYAFNKHFFNSVHYCILNTDLSSLTQNILCLNSVDIPHLPLSDLSLTLHH